MKPFFLGALVLAAALAGCSPRTSEGERAPDFTLPTLADATQTVTLSEAVREQPVLLIFWASWCPTCVEEIPVLNEWFKEFTPKGLKILSVNVQEDPKDVKQFLEKQPVAYPVVLDRDGEVAERFGLSGLPAAVFVAKGGEILYYGFSLPGHMDQLLQRGGEIR